LGVGELNDKLKHVDLTKLASFSDRLFSGLRGSNIEIRVPRVAKAEPFWAQN
jgi:hypothetical protein